MAVKDPQARKVYNAEWSFRDILSRQYEAPLVQIHGSHIVVPAERKFGNIENVTTYVNAVCGTLGHTAPRVRERAGQLKAHYEGAKHVIAIPIKTRWALTESVVLHELAHSIAHDSPAHGARFAGTFLELVQQFMGEEAHFILMCLFLDNDVKFDLE